MNYDYHDSQVEVVYLLGVNNDRTLKKTPDGGAPGDNRLFEAHMAGMTGEGWALVSIADAAEAAMPPAPYKPGAAQRSQTSSYRLSWKRLKLV